MGWMWFQTLVVFAVVASNIHWQWTPNMTLATLLGVLLACILTGLISDYCEKARAAKGDMSRARDT